MKLNKEIIKDICDDYKKGETTVTLSSKYGVSVPTVCYWLKKNNIKIHGQRKYEIIEDYFDTIDTPEKSYFLGLLFSDGTNIRHKNTRNVILSLNKKDEYLLKHLSSIIYKNNDRELSIIKERDFKYRGNKIGHSKEGRKLIISNKHISDILYNIGMVNNKSLILKFPNIPRHLFSHFIRGYFDGDGCIFVDGKYGASSKISIVGTQDVCNNINLIIQKELNITGKIYNTENERTKKLYIFRKHNVVKFLEWLYHESKNLFLIRKFQKFVQLKERINNKPIKQSTCIFCGAAAYAKGFCRYHYDKMRRNKKKQ